MYGLRGFGEMIADQVRMGAYAEALRRSVKPGDVVLDLGAGTGIMSLLACQLGARHVYAVEASAYSQLLVAFARDNGFSDRITVLQGRSTEVTLPELANVLVSDLRGALPPYHTHLADIADARARLLMPGGVQIPGRDRLYVALVSAEPALLKAREIWQRAPFGMDLRAALGHAQHTWEKLQVEPDALLSAPECWAELAYTTRVDPQVSGTCTLIASRTAPAHGLLAWFDTELVEGVGFSNAPSAPRAIYGAVFFPWPERLALEASDAVDVELRADPNGDAYRWSWLSALRRGAAHHVEQRFVQSDFLATPVSPEALRKRGDEFVATLSEQGEFVQRVLASMARGNALGVIAQELHAHAPTRFATEGQAFEFVADLSERYAR